MGANSHQLGSIQKWDDAGSSFTQIPNVLLEHLKRLELTPQEALMLILIAKYWWNTTGDNVPYPSVDTLANLMNRNKRQAQRILKSLEDNDAPVKNRWSDTNGYIMRKKRPNPKTGRRSSDYLHLGPLVNALNCIYKEQAKRREESDKGVNTRRPTAPRR